MTEQSEFPRLLTVQQAADRLAVTPATIRSWILRREKLDIVKVGRCVRITEESVAALIAQHTIRKQERGR